jgi:hypothetical protein
MNIHVKQTNAKYLLPQNAPNGLTSPSVAPREGRAPAEARGRLIFSKPCAVKRKNFIGVFQ